MPAGPYWSVTGVLWFADKKKNASAAVWVSGKAKSGCHRRVTVKNVNYGGGKMNEHMKTNN